MRTPLRASIWVRAPRFSLSRKVATEIGTWALIWAERSLSTSSSITRMMDRASERTSRMTPVPLQRGQTRPVDSSSDGRRRWRDNSSRPNLEMRPIWMRARSMASASRRRSSTARWCLTGVMSMKSMTMRPPMSRRRSWRAISSAASRLVLSAVSSMSEPFVAREELMSMDTSASVGSITMDPPEGSFTSRWKAVSIWLSIW